jgi:hypothetical protein
VVSLVLSLVVSFPQAVNMSEETATKIKMRLILTPRFYNRLNAHLLGNQELESHQVRGPALLASGKVAPGFRIALGGLEN